MEKKPKNKKKVIITIVSLLLAILFIVLPVTTIAVYESVFGTRYETTSWMAFSVEEYEGLQMEVIFNPQMQRLPGINIPKPIKR